MMVAAWEDTAGAVMVRGGVSVVAGRPVLGSAGARVVARCSCGGGVGAPVRVVPGRVWWARVRRRRASRMEMRSRSRRKSAVFRQPSSAGDLTTAGAPVGEGVGQLASVSLRVSVPLAAQALAPVVVRRALRLVVARAAASLIARVRVWSTAPAAMSWRYSTQRASSSTSAANMAAPG